MSDQPIATTASAITAFVGLAPTGPVNAPRLVTSLSHFTVLFGGLWPGSHLGYSVRDFFRHGGSAAVVVRADPDAEATPALMQGLAALEAHTAADEQAADPIGLIVVPPTAAQGGDWSDPDPTVLREAVHLAARAGAVAVLDPPAGWTSVASALGGIPALEGLRGPNAALYFPRIIAVDPLSGARRTFGPAGAVAGVIARTDARDGVWTAPAGEHASLDVGSLTSDVTQRDDDALNDVGVNAIRRWAPRGIRVWGSRTLATAPSEWTYVSVRRLTLFIEHSLSRGLRWTAFEPNDEQLWRRVRHATEAFLHELHGRGAMGSASLPDAWYVRCDSSTMTQRDVDEGRLNVEVGVAPLRPAEFVTLQIRLGALPSGQP
jgi:phage tail sheath protein FI